MMISDQLKQEILEDFDAQRNTLLQRALLHEHRSTWYITNFSSRQMLPVSAKFNVIEKRFVELGLFVWGRDNGTYETIRL